MTRTQQQEALWQRYDSSVRSLIAETPLAFIRPVLLRRGLLLPGAQVAVGQSAVRWAKLAMMDLDELAQLLRELRRAVLYSQLAPLAPSVDVRPDALDETFDETTAVTGPITLPREG